MNPLSLAALTVDLSAIRENARHILSEHPAAGLIPVLKADAYGLGMVPVAKALAPLPGVLCFAVAQAQEGVALRRAGIERDILILGETLPWQVEAALQSRLTPTVARPEDVDTVANAARTLGMTADIQIKFDTGLHRLGVEEATFATLCERLAANADAVRPAGAYSHFADPGDAARCEAQYRLFLSLCDRLRQAGFAVPLRHICDSAASEAYPAYALDAVRIGRRLAWDAPDRPTGRIREAATLSALVTDVRSRKAGDRLGYGDGPVLQKDAVIASIGIGYGDGLDPRFAGSLSVLLHGKRCPVLYLFMDRALVDVTDAAASAGDRAVLFGQDETGASLSAQAQASAIGALEGCGLTTALLPRVERIYIP